MGEWVARQQFNGHIMKTSIRKQVLTVGSLFAALGALAGPLQRADVINDPVWVLHVDCDALRQTTVGKQLLAELNNRFLPNRIVLAVDSEESRQYLAGLLPVIKTMTASGGKTTAYVCEDYACKLPTSDPKKFGELLQ